MRLRKQQLEQGDEDTNEVGIYYVFLHAYQSLYTGVLFPGPIPS